jgi:hypothetical protein
VPWSRLRGQPPGLRRLPKDDQPPRPAPLLTRRSRIAAYAGIPAAFAGGQLAAFFLNQFVLYYHLV